MDVVFRGSDESGVEQYSELVMKTMVEEVTIESNLFNNVHAFSDSATTQLFPIPNCPELYRASLCSWTTSEAPHVSMVAIAQALLDCTICKVDFDPSPETYSLKGVAYGADSSKSDFSLHLYNAPPKGSPDRYLINLTRVSGCAITFSALFHELQSICDPSSVSSPSPLPPLPSLPLPPLPSSLADPDDQQQQAALDADTAILIVEQAVSPNARIRQLGLSLLASSCTQPENHPELLACPFFESAISKSILSPDDVECTRMAVVALAALLESSDSSNATFDQHVVTLIQPLIALLTRKEDLFTLELNRCVAHCLSLLSRHPSISSHLPSLQKLPQISDPVTIATLAEIVATINAATA